jgi:hypothetical protein
MRTLINTLLIASFLSLSWNLSASGETCRESLNYYDDLPNFMDAVNLDLLAGVWAVDGTYTFNRNTQSTMFQFQESGLLDVFTTDLEDKVSYTSKHWYVTQFGDNAFLIVEETPGSNDHLFEINQTCEGMTLVDRAGGETIYLTYMPKSEDLEMIKSSLLGVWESSEYPFEIAESIDDCGTYEEMEGAFIQYQFNYDGTFQRTYGSDALLIIEAGVWSLSEDGGHITLFFTKGSNAEEVEGTAVLSIEDIHGDDLEILQSIESSDFQSFFCTPVKKTEFKRVNRS